MSVQHFGDLAGSEVGTLLAEGLVMKWILLTALGLTACTTQGALGDADDDGGKGGAGAAPSVTVGQGGGGASGTGGSSSSPECPRLVAEDFDIDELELLRQRAAGRAAFNFNVEGDVVPGSPGEWQRLLSSRDAFVASMAHFVEQPMTDAAGDLVTPDFYNFYDGPIPGPRTTNPPGPYWDGQGAIPSWARATKKPSGNGFVPCSASDPYYRCQDAFTYADDLLAAALVAQVEQDEALMQDVRRVLLRQTDVVRAPGVDFSNRSRWALGNQGQGLGGGQQVSSTNPFFFTALWVVKIAKSYDYTRNTVADGCVVESPIYSAEERDQVESWLYHAAEFYRLAVEQFLLEEVAIFDSVEARIQGEANANINNPPYQDFSLWDGGPIATYGQLLYQNRITDSALAFCVVGSMLAEPTLKRDCKLFFQEVIRYGMRPDGTLGDYYRGGQQGETGQHYVSGQLAHLAEMADLFARHGDPSLYTYETSEGSTHPNHADASTIGGPKSLLAGLRVSARMNRPQGYEGRHKQGQLINGDTAGSGRRYLQHFLTWARANTFYRDAELAALLDGDASQGFRPLQSPSTVLNNGYVLDVTRGTFAASPGELFLHGRKAHCEESLFPFPGAAAPPCL